MSYFEQREKYLEKTTKTVLVQGEPASSGTPTRFDTVEVLLTIHTMEGEEILLHQNRAEPFKTKIGDLDLQRGLSVAISTMTKGEKSKFIIPDEFMVEGRDSTPDTEKPPTEAVPVVTKPKDALDEIDEKLEEEAPENGVQSELMDTIPEPEEKPESADQLTEATISSDTTTAEPAEPKPTDQILKPQPQPFSVVEIELLSWSSSNGKACKWDLDDSEKLPWILKLKEKGNAHLKAEEWPQAEDCYNTAIEIVEWDQDPTRKQTKVLCMYNLSIALAKQKKFVSALERVTWAINIAPSQAKGHFRRAGVYLEMQEFEQALEDLNKALDVEPGNPDVHAMVAKVKTIKQQYVQDNCKMFGSILGKNVYEQTAASVSEYSDNFSPRVLLDLARHEKVVCLEIELFEHLVPQACTYFLSLVNSGLLPSYRCTEVKSENFLIFDTIRKQEKIIQQFKNENTKVKIKDVGFVFFRPDKETGVCSTEIGISLAPLPWFDNEWVPFGFIRKPQDIKNKLSSLFEVAFKNGVSEVTFGSAKQATQHK